MPNDFGFVEISIDGGANWVQIGEPLTGTQLSPWRRDLFSLSDFCGPGFTTVNIRFRLETDAENASIGWFIDDITLVPEKMPVTQARQDLKRPGIYVLEQNYPNPFNPITVINFIMPREEFIRLEIFNLLGEQVELLIADRVAEGSHSYTWDANDLPNGVYLYRLTTSEFSQTRKMLLVR
jgi:hypothetical protein